MTRIWAWFLSTRVGRWIVGIGAVLAAIATACLYWFERGKREQAGQDQAKAARVASEAAQAAQQAQQRSAEVVEATHEEVAKMADGGTQRVGDAAPDTAAGWLREHANRDQAGP